MKIYIYTNESKSNETKAWFRQLLHHPARQQIGLYLYNLRTKCEVDVVDDMVHMEWISKTMEALNYIHPHSASYQTNSSQGQTNGVLCTCCLEKHLTDL